MLKKLLTLSLVAVMLSTVALASNGVVGFGVATYAEEAEEVTETFDYTTYEILRVRQTTDTTQTIAKLSVGGDNEAYTNTTARWYLVKVNVGKDWGTFTSITSKLGARAVKGNNYVYRTSLTKAEYDTAVAAAGTTVDSFLSEPSVVAADTKTQWKNHTGSNGSVQTATLSLGENQYTYEDGCLYFACQLTVENGSYPYGAMGLSKTENYITTVKGTKVETPVVDDFSDAEVTYDNTTGAYTIATTTTTGEAYLIIASFTETTMNDVELVTVNAADAEEGVISGTIPQLDEGTIKIFLWDKATLAPATAVQ